MSGDGGVFAGIIDLCAFRPRLVERLHERVGFGGLGGVLRQSRGGERAIRGSGISAANGSCGEESALGA